MRDSLSWHSCDRGDILHMIPVIFLCLIVQKSQLLVTLTSASVSAMTQYYNVKMYAL